MKLFPHQEAALKATADRNRVAIKGFESLYEVDSSGRVFSIVGNAHRRKRELKLYQNECGYLKVNLYDLNGKCKKKYVHRLVAEAFLPNPEHYPEVNHIDCNKQNNTIDNLEWCNRFQNLKHSYDNGKKRQGESHGLHKLTEKEVSEIRRLLDKVSQIEIASRYSISQSTVSAIKCGRLWNGGDAKCQD